MVRSFEQLADTFVLGIWPFYAGGVAAVYALRRRCPDLPRPYRVLGYPITPALFLLAALFLVANAVIDDLRNVLVFFKTGSAPSGTGGTLLVFGIILAGIPVYWLWKRSSPHQTSLDLGGGG
jgi:APA family basic amino acid/polyamine antiporter